MKKIAIPLVFFVAGILSTVGFAFAQSVVSFPDVKSTDWFYKDVMNMVEWGVIKGNDDGTFKPQANVNRAELSAMWNRYDERVSNLINAYDQNAENNYGLIENLESRLELAEFKIDANDLEAKINNNFQNVLNSPSFWCTGNSLMFINATIGEYNDLVKRTVKEENKKATQDILTTLSNGINFVNKTCTDKGYPLEEI